MPKAPYRLVLVEWEDSARPDPDWRYLDPTDWQKVVRCWSVGFLVSETKDVMALAPNLGDVSLDTEQACGIIRIPVRCIIKRVRLSELAS